MPTYPHVTLACVDCKLVGSVPASDSTWQLPRQCRGPCYDSDETNLDQTWAMEKYVTYYGLICPRMKTNTVKIWSNKVNIWKEGECFEKRVTKIRHFTVATLSSPLPLCRHHRHFVVTVATLLSLLPLCLHCVNFVVTGNGKIGDLSWTDLQKYEDEYGHNTV